MPLPVLLNIRQPAAEQRYIVVATAGATNASAICIPKYHLSFIFDHISKNLVIPQAFYHRYLVDTFIFSQLTHILIPSIPTIMLLLRKCYIIVTILLCDRPIHTKDCRIIAIKIKIRRTKLCVLISIAVPSYLMLSANILTSVVNNSLCTFPAD